MIVLQAIGNVLAIIFTLAGIALVIYYIAVMSELLKHAGKISAALDRISRKRGNK